MGAFKRIYFFVFIFFYAIIFFTKYNDIGSIAKFAIPLFVFIVFTYSLLSFASFNGSSVLLPLALFFTFIGDTLINLTTHKDLCIVAFSLTHTCLIILYFLLKKFEKTDFLVLIPILALTTILLIAIHNDIQTRFLQIVFIAYLCILNVMLWRAFCLLKSSIRAKIKVLFLTGSVLFFATDILVCLQVIYGYKIFVTFTWLLYPPALYFLSSTCTEKITKNV